MKRILLLIFIIGFVFDVAGYDKKSLVERFTNASCAPCASLNTAWYNATTTSMLQAGTISQIIYNVWWPGAGDPMYLLNTPDNTSRTNYYGVNSVPWIVVNGSTTATVQSTFVNAVNNGNAQFSPFKIVMTQRALSDNLIEVGVKILRDPSDVTTFGTTKLRVALTEKMVVFPSPPGTNGETHFSSVSRKMLTDANGTTLTVPAPGDSVEIILQYVPTTAFLQSVNMDSLRVVAFIQNETNKTIYQSEMFEMIPNFVAEINASSPDVIAENTTPAVFSSVIKNIGMMTDKYIISCTLTSPLGWTGEFDAGNGNQPFGVLDSVEVAPGDSATISVTVNPQGINGFGQTTIQFTSVNNPGMVGDVKINNVTKSGNNVLIISAGDRQFESYITSSLESVYTGTFGAVSRSALQPNDVSLSDFDIVIWQGGNSSRAFYQEEINKLQNYLDNGGNLLITGQDIGSDIFETSGQSQFAQDFYHNYLHTDYVANISNLFIIKGIVNDVISNGIQFVANTVYTRSLDKISPIDSNATSFLTYFNGPDVAGVRSIYNNYRVIYMTTGFEQITEQAIRDTILSRSVRWLSENVIAPALEVVAHQTHIDSTLGSELIFDFEVVNISQVQQTVFEVRTLNTLPTDWTSSLCFDSTCFSPGLDSVTTEPPFGAPLEPGDTLHTSLHIFAMNNSGTANVQIQIGTLQNPTDRVTLDFSATAIATSVEDKDGIVTEYSLNQNFPNPFNPSTSISFSIPEKSYTTLKIYDILGNEVADLLGEEKSAGNYEIQFDASKLTSGVYFYKLQSRGFVSTRKMLLLK